MATQPQETKQLFQNLVREHFTRLVTDGVVPNEAAARAISLAQESLAAQQKIQSAVNAIVENSVNQAETTEAPSTPAAAAPATPSAAPCPPSTSQPPPAPAKEPRPAQFPAAGAAAQRSISTGISASTAPSTPVLQPSRSQSAPTGKQQPASPPATSSWAAKAGGLSGAALLDMLQAAMVTDEWTPVVRTLGRVFSTPEQLTASFLPPPPSADGEAKAEGEAAGAEGPGLNDEEAVVGEGEGEGEGSGSGSGSGSDGGSDDVPSAQRPCIDWVALDTCYALIADLGSGGDDSDSEEEEEEEEEESARAERAMWGALQRLCAELTWAASSWRQPRQLRLFLLLLAHPGLRAAAQQSVLTGILRAIMALQVEARRILVQWFCYLRCSRREQIVNTLHAMITRRLWAGDTTEVFLAAHVLHMLFAANQISPDPMDSEAFVSDTVCDELDVINDYRLWLTKLGDGSGSPVPSPPPPPLGSIAAVAPNQLARDLVAEAAASAADDEPEAGEGAAAVAVETEGVAAAEAEAAAAAAAAAEAATATEASEGAAAAAAAAGGAAAAVTAAATEAAAAGETKGEEGASGATTDTDTASAVAMVGAEATQNGTAVAQAWAGWESALHTQLVSASTAVAMGRGGPPLAFCEMPFLLDTAMKAAILRLDARSQMRAGMREMLMRGLEAGDSPFLLLIVRRESVVMDTLTQVARLSPSELKKPLKVKFKGEEGVDEGGVRKEFFQVMMRQLLDPQFGMLIEQPDAVGVAWFNSHSLESAVQFELIGILMGLAIFNGVILELPFPPVVYAKLLGHTPTLEHLRDVQPMVYRSLKKLLAVEDASALHLDFHVTSTSPWGVTQGHELLPGGDAVDVDNSNRREYVQLYLHHLLTGSVSYQFSAFAKGFLTVCDGFPLKLLCPSDLQLLVCGSPVLDFTELQRATEYEEPFHEEHPLIIAFWETVHELSPEQQKQLLSFATGSARAPINGLGALRFVISRAGPDSEQLPTSHTCFNHLLLPEYGSGDKLKRCLLLAITQSEGFGLL